MAATELSLRVTVVRPGETLSCPIDVCVVIDVLRATTTATVLGHRFGEFLVAPRPDDLRSLPEHGRGYALFSELAGIDAEMPRFDNSPVQAMAADLGRRMPVLVTTNGTRAIALASGLTREVVLGSFTNLSAVVEHVRASGASTVGVMPAGSMRTGRPRAEDDACAEMLRELVREGTADVQSVIASCLRDPRIVTRRLRDPGFSEDVDLSFDVDVVPVVPRVRNRVAQHCFRIEPV